MQQHSSPLRCTNDCFILCNLFEVILLKKLLTHWFCIPLLQFWCCRQHSHSWADPFRAPRLSESPKPAAHGKCSPSFMVPWDSAESSISVTAIIKITQISHFSIQRTNHSPQQPLPRVPALQHPQLELCWPLLGHSLARGCSESPWAPHRVLQCLGSRGSMQWKAHYPSTKNRSCDKYS